MKKIILLSLIFYMHTLMAKEPTLAILQNTISNTQQIFSIGQQEFVCNTYGVLGTAELLNRKNLNSSCKKQLLLFYKKYPLSKYYAQKILHAQQRYHVRFKGEKCLLYAQGQKTLSELLLRQGFVILEPHFKDKELSAIFEQAYANAKQERRGVHKDGVLRECFSEFYK